MKDDIGKKADLPALYKAELTREELEELLEDIRSLGVHKEIRWRDGSVGTARVGHTEMNGLGARLAESEQSSAQIRYEFEGENWCDSITRVGEQFRLVRMKTPALPVEPTKN